MSILEKRLSGAEVFWPKKPIFIVGETVSVVEPFCDRKCCFEEIYKAKILKISADEYRVYRIDDNEIVNVLKWDIKKL